jgi:WD40 repeat protein
MRMADSGDLTGQRQASPNHVVGVAVAFKAGMVIGGYYSGRLWIWSFGESGPEFAHSKNSPAVVNRLPRAIDFLCILKRARPISLIAFTGDGKMAASCSSSDKFVLVWDTATGTVLWQLDINKGASLDYIAGGCDIEQL